MYTFKLNISMHKIYITYLEALSIERRFMLTRLHTNIMYYNKYTKKILKCIQYVKIYYTFAFSDYDIDFNSCNNLFIK